MLDVDRTVLLVIDVQEKLSRVIYQKEELIDNLQKLIRGIKVLNVPILVTEQYPQGLGQTIPEIAQLLNNVKPSSKISFSCCADEDLLKRLETLSRKQVLISGIESHVCVYQTVSDLISLGYEAHVVTDTISSRTPENREIGFKLMSQLGAILTSTETVLFELLKVAKGDRFRDISKIVK